MLAAEAAGAKAVQEKLRSRAANIRFAEDTEVDRSDAAGMTMAEQEGAYERVVEEQLAKIPAYRSRGKNTRSGWRSAVSERNEAATATEAAANVRWAR